MPILPSGMFADLIEEVEASTANIQEIINSYPSSKAGKDLRNILETEFWKFYKLTWEGLDGIGGVEEKLIKAHFYERVSLDNNLLGFVVYRSFRRALYCKCFNNIELAQMKQAGLLAYWITRIRPIIVSKRPEGLERLPKKHETALQEINATYAFFIIDLFYRNEFKTKMSNAESFKAQFTLAATHRSFTEDSMMLLTQALGTS